jgi:hypothetical protein
MITISPYAWNSSKDKFTIKKLFIYRSLLVKIIYTRGEYAGNYNKILLRSSETIRETPIVFIG